MIVGAVFKELKWSRFVPALVVGAGVLAYANSFLNPFILDDVSTVLRTHLAESHLWPLRCVVDLSFRCNALMGGDNVADYHLLNLVIHLVAGLLLYGIVRRTLLLAHFQGCYERSASWLAAVSAALWVAHPLQTESVTYICQRYESLMGMFYLLTLYAFIRSAARIGDRLWSMIAVAACALGMASKEGMITAPFMVLLYDYVFLSTGWRQVVRARWRIHSAILGTCGVLVVLVVIRINANLDAGVPTLSEISSLDYLLTQCGVVVHYLRLSFYPHALCLDYAWPPARHWLDILPHALFLTTLLAGTVWAVSRRFPSGYLGAWFFVVLAPTSSIFPMGDMAFEHRMYLPLVAPICWMVVLIYRAASAVVERVGINERATMSVWSVVVALLLASAVWLTLCRNADYHSEIALWQDVVAKRPNNCRAQSTLTIALLREQRFTEAEVSARSLLDTLNRLEKGQEGAFRFSERMAVYYRHLALNGLGQSFLGQGRMDLAADCFRKQEEAGGNARSAYDLARILYLLDREEESLNFCELTLKRDPKFGRAYVLKGCLLERRQQYNEAAACYRKALALIPNDASAECRLAWLLATCPDDAVRDAEEAVVLAQAVCRQTGGYNGRVFDILAAAYAEKGDIAAAVRTQEKAVKMATESLEDSRKRGISLPESLEEALVGGVPLKDMMYRLDLYRQGKPYRDER